MKIVYHKNFIKSYKMLPQNLKSKVQNTILVFSKTPKAKSLRNHVLKGKLKGKRAISVTNDYRIIFEEHDNYVVVIMLDLGTHNQVY